MRLADPPLARLAGFGEQLRANALSRQKLDPEDDPERFSARLRRHCGVDVADERRVETQALR